MVLGFFAVTLFVSAFLLFLVQPMIGKLILPKLGGTPQVWNTCMVFFQSTLLAGYAYTHSTSTRLSVRRQLLVHCILLIVPLIVLLPPIGPFDITSWIPPQGGNPILSTLLLLTIIVGLPFFVVSTSAPLLQKWFVHTDDPAAKDPYFLYAASNFGSMLGLLAYPFLIEWVLPLQAQKWMWLVGYLLLIVTVGACAFLVLRSPRIDDPIAEPEMPPPETPAPPVEPKQVETAVTAKPPTAASKLSKRKKKRRGKARDQIDIKAKPEATEPKEHVPDDNITVARRIRWVLLAAAPSSLMLGLTTYVSVDMSPFPLIWVVPLALYLLSFILVFMRQPIPWISSVHPVVVYTHPIAIFGFCWVLLARIHAPLNAMAVTWIAFLWTALLCHGELAKNRPSAKHLTEFYLWMSVGGMLGGMFNALFAPIIFTNIVEFPLAIILVCFLRPLLKKDGWLDTYILSSFPNLFHWSRETGRRWSSVAAQSFLAFWGVFVVAVVIVGYLMISSGIPTFVWITVLFIAGTVLMALLALRFWPDRTVSLSLDILLPMLVVFLALFLIHNSTQNWNWNPRYVNVGDNNLTGILKMFGLVNFDTNQAVHSAIQLTEKAYIFLIYGIPIIIGLMFAARPIRMGVAVGAVLLLSLYPVGRESNVLFAGRSYFGVLRVVEGQDAFRMLFQPMTVKGDKTDLHLPNPGKMRLARSQDGEPIPGYYVVRTTRMTHGNILHGNNFQDEQLHRLATTYYHRKGPLGFVMEKINWFPGPQNTYWADNRLPASLVANAAAGLGTVSLPTAPLVTAWSEPPYATVGLGTGTMASYGRPYQHVTFYEIDENVRNFSLPREFWDSKENTVKAIDYSLPLKKRKRYFTYLTEAIRRGARLEVIMGDARLSLLHETQRRSRYGYDEVIGPPGLYPKREGYYRVMEIDAFSSDAIPIHLATKEAIELYMSKSAPNGVVCMHTSNRYVELEQAVVDIAVDLGFKYVYASDRDVPYLGHSGSTYVMIARDEKYLVNRDDKGAIIPHPSFTERYFDRQKDKLQTRTIEPFQWMTPRASGNPVWTDDFSNIVRLIRW